MTNQAISINTLNPIAYNNIPVLTTDLLAQLYCTDEHNLIKNYRENLTRFIEGKHYFKLEGKELKAFKNYITNSDLVQIPKNTRHFILWTERGAARHAKMLDTDQA